MQNQRKYVVPTLGGHTGPPLQADHVRRVRQAIMYAEYDRRIMYAEYDRRIMYAEYDRRVMYAEYDNRDMYVYEISHPSPLKN